MRLGTIALTLALTWGAVGAASAQDTAPWNKRLFSSSPAEKADPDKTPAVKVDAPKISTATVNGINQAKADLDRRQEVCLKLREIGIDSNDDALVRRADELHQRAWDLYVAATSRVRTSQRPIGEVSTKDLGLDKKGGR